MSSPTAPLACPVGLLPAVCGADTVFTPLFVWVVSEVVIPPFFVARCYWHLHPSSLLLLPYGFFSYIFFKAEDNMPSYMLYLLHCNQKWDEVET
eukprot:3765708-Amphidinium_carterae.1